jgi:hypothetical protein
MNPARRTNFPLWAAFLVGFLMPLAGIILGVLFYNLDSMRDPEAGKYCIIGAAVGFVAGCLCWVPLMFFM